MIISRTPFRVSLLGGGSDYPVHSDVAGGTVLGFALRRYCYLTLRRLPPFFEHRHRIAYSRIELVRDATEVEHPVVRAVLTEHARLVNGDGLELHHDGDVPARGGLGSSSSFAVGLLHALWTLYGHPVTPERLALEATRIERDVLGDTVGSQDQLFAAYGGVNRFDFHRREADEPRPLSTVRPVVLSDDREADLVSRLLLVYTGNSRIASVVAADQVARAMDNRAILVRLAGLAVRGEAILRDGPLDDLGRLLDEAWHLKRSLAPNVSTPLVDALYHAALDAGALGGKLLGAGGGGFMLFYAAPDAMGRIAAALRAICPYLVEVPVAIDRGGSRIVLNEPNGFPR